MDAFTNAFSNAFDPNKNGVANTFAPVTSALTSASTWNSVKTGAELGGMSIVDTLSPVPVFGTGGIVGLSIALSKNGGNLNPTASPPAGTLPTWLQGEFTIGGRQIAKLWVYSAAAAAALLLIL